MSLMFDGTMVDRGEDQQVQRFKRIDDKHFQTFWAQGVAEKYIKGFKGSTACKGWADMHHELICKPAPKAGEVLDDTHAIDDHFAAQAL